MAPLSQCTAHTAHPAILPYKLCPHLYIFNICAVMWPEARWILGLLAWCRVYVQLVQHFTGMLPPTNVTWLKPKGSICKIARLKGHFKRPWTIHMLWSFVVDAFLGLALLFHNPPLAHLPTWPSQTNFSALQWLWKVPFVVFYGNATSLVCLDCPPFPLNATWHWYVSWWRWFWKKSLS